jgi:hypothetical protein
MNVKNNLKNFYTNFKKETALIDTYLTAPKKWEQIVSIFLIVIYCVFEYMRINEIEPSFWIRIGVGFGFFGWTCAVANQARRDFKGLNLYWQAHLIPELKQLWFNPTFYKKMPIISSTLLANSWKLGKLVIKACAACVGVGTTFNFAFADYYGFSPLQELRAYNLGLQTKEQMINHIFINPSDYVDNTDKPYVQDLKRSILKKDEEIQKLTQALENARKG